MLCCVCLGETTDCMGIFNEMGERLNAAKIVQQHMWFKPDPSDKYLANICLPCWGTIAEFHDFYQQTERAHAEHQLRKNTLILKEEVAQSSSSVKLESDEEMYRGNFDQFDVAIDVKTKQNEKLETEEDTPQNPLASGQDNGGELEREIYTYLEQNLETCEETNKQSNPLDEEEKSEDEFDMEYISDEYEPSDISNANQSSSDEEENIKEETLLIEVKNQSKTKKTRTRTRKRKAEAKDLNGSEQVPKKKRNVYKLDPKHTEEMILKHIPMGCTLCVFVGKTFADIVEHFKDAHPKVRAHILCCDKKLTKRFYVAQHALKHEDPNCFNCLECNKSFTTTCGLRAHNLNYHAPEEERIYSCDLCPKKFARPNLLELHKTSHIPRDEWQFFCTKCPTRKSFASEYLLNIHTSMQHKRAKHICHVCAKEIRDKYSFEKHVRLHFEDSGPRLPCPYPDCESWLKDEDNLKQHLQRHNPEGITYKCTECDKVCKNRRALTNHKRYAHSNETFPCEQCDKTFKKAISLREHMTQHTGETLYKCPFCPRTFNSNANMHAHKKRQHPIEWDEWRRNKKGSAQVLITKTNSLHTLGSA